MKAIYMFMAFRVVDGRKLELLNTDLLTPGEDLFHGIRTFGSESGIGKYRRLDLNPENRTSGFHLFEHGVVKIEPVVLEVPS